MTPEHHDTHEIVKIYLSRPNALIRLSLGDWFTLAHGIDDPALYCEESTSKAKDRLISQGYVNLPLDPLKAFNAEYKSVEGQLRPSRP